MNTIYNMFILNLKYTLPFVLGIYVLELIAKTLCSAILGHLNIPDFWVKLNLKPRDKQIDTPKNSFTDYELQRGSNYVPPEVKRTKSDSDILERLKGFK